MANGAPDYEMPVERGKIRELARAAYAPWPEYLNEPYPVMHPILLMTAGVYWGYTLERPRGTLFEQLGHDLAVPLHAEESYHFHGTLPRAGTLLTARACLEDVVEKQGGRGGTLTFLTMLTEFRDESGRLAAEARAVTVTTSSSPDDDPAGFGPRFRIIGLRTPAWSRRIPLRTSNDNPGMGSPSVRVPVLSRPAR